VEMIGVSVLVVVAAMVTGDCDIEFGNVSQDAVKAAMFKDVDSRL
jgi:hypothetical protein